MTRNVECPDTLRVGAGADCPGQDRLGLPPGPLTQRKAVDPLRCGPERVCDALLSMT